MLRHRKTRFLPQCYTLSTHTLVIYARRRQQVAVGVVIVMVGASGGGVVGCSVLAIEQVFQQPPASNSHDWHATVRLHLHLLREYVCVCALCVCV